ncbi:MAG: response regulator [Nitrospiraceae bacterium]
MTFPHPSLLIVDDDPDICQALTDLFEYDHYLVKTVGTGAEAVANAMQCHFDAAILDLGLPDADGLTVFRKLMEVAPDLPVVILTAFNTEERRTESYHQGVAAYLTKPYDKEVLKATLNHAMGRTHQ